MQTFIRQAGDRLGVSTLPTPSSLPHLFLYRGLRARRSNGRQQPEQSPYLRRRHHRPLAKADV